MSQSGAALAIRGGGQGRPFQVGNEQLLWTLVWPLGDRECSLLLGNTQSVIAWLCDIRVSLHEKLQAGFLGATPFPSPAAAWGSVCPILTALRPF